MPVSRVKTKGENTKPENNRNVHLERERVKPQTMKEQQQLKCCHCIESCSFIVCGNIFFPLRRYYLAVILCAWARFSSFSFFCDNKWIIAWNSISIWFKNSNNIQISINDGCLIGTHSAIGFTRKNMEKN